VPGGDENEVTATEEDLDAFMADHEALLAAADAFEPLRNAGGMLMEVYAEETDRLYGELLRLCRQVVQAMYENESAGDPDKFDPDAVDCKPLAAIAEEATRRAEAHRALLEACTVEEPDGDVISAAEATALLAEVGVKPRRELQQPRNASEGAFRPGGMRPHGASTGKRRPGPPPPHAQQPPGFFGRVVASLFGAQPSSARPPRAQGGGRSGWGGAGAPPRPAGGGGARCKPDMELMEQLCGLGLRVLPTCLPPSLVGTSQPSTRALATLSPRALAKLPTMPPLLRACCTAPLAKSLLHRATC
jgi:hypothetical protein